MKIDLSKKTSKTAACGLLSAFAVVLLYLGCLIEPLDLSLTVIASVCVIFTVIEMPGAYPWAVYAVTSALSLLLLPSKLPALYFALFGGIYPILKEYFERLHPVISWVLKLSSFGTAFLLLVVFVNYVFGIPDTGIGFYPWLMLGSAAVFVLYDIALSRLITMYLLKLRKRLGFPDRFPK